MFPARKSFQLWPTSCVCLFGQHPVCVWTAPPPCRDKLDKTYDKLKFKRQEEAALVMDLQQVEARLGNLELEHRGVAATVEEMARRRAEAGRLAEEQAEKLARAQRQVAKMQGRTGGEGSPLAKEADLAEVRVRRGGG